MLLNKVNKYFSFLGLLNVIKWVLCRLQYFDVVWGVFFVKVNLQYEEWFGCFIQENGYFVWFKINNCYYNYIFI